MYTSVMLVALAGLSAAPEASQVSWEASYTAASKKGSQTNKPLAVFVGSGAQGWKGVTSEKKLSAAAVALLREGYVCVYVDATTPAGEKLASAFELNGTGGLVLSTRNGKSQAFSHVGEMTTADLESTLKKYADPTLVVAVTEGLGTQSVRYSYVPGTTTGATSTVPGSYLPGPTYSGSSYAPGAYPGASYGGSSGGFTGGFSGGFSGGGGGGRGGC